MGQEQPIIVEREPRVHRITVEEFLALDEAGFFAEVGRVELIDGEIYEMAPLHRPHARALADLTTDLNIAVRRLDINLDVLSPVSARLDSHSLPEADIMVAIRTEERLVTGETVRLMVEVSDTSLGHDLRKKAALYARTGVPEYWVADVNGQRVIRMHAPEGEAYRERTEFAFGEPVPSATIAGLIVDTTRLA